MTPVVAAWFTSFETSAWALSLNPEGCCLVETLTLSLADCNELKYGLRCQTRQCMLKMQKSVHISNSKWNKANYLQYNIIINNNVQPIKVILGYSAMYIIFFIDGFRPRRSLVFASWSAGEYGSVGATEWLEVRTAQLWTNNSSSLEMSINVSGFF